MYKLTHYSAAELIQEHREELHGYLVRQTRCPETASDILQDAFLRLKVRIFTSSNVLLGDALFCSLLR